MKFYAFIVLSVFAYLQVQAGPVAAPEKVTEPTPEKVTKTTQTAPVEETNDVAADVMDDKDDADADDENDLDTEPDFESQSPHGEHETTSNTSHLFQSTPESASPSATPNLDAFMRAFEAIDQHVYSEIETFLENIVPKLPENNNPITNHLESAVFLFELYEKMKEPRDLNNSQEQHFLSEIENFLASNSFLLFNKPTVGRQDVDDEIAAADQDGDEKEFELNDDLLQDNNLDDEDAAEKDRADEDDEKDDEQPKSAAVADKHKIEPQGNVAAAA